MTATRSTPSAALVPSTSAEVGVRLSKRDWSALRVLLLALGALIYSPARADHDPRHIPGYPLQIEAFDAREVAMLPAYCKYTQIFRGRVPGSDNASEAGRWERVQGPIFLAMHHYCFGLMSTNRALLLAGNPQTKAAYLHRSINEFDYVIERAPRDFALLPEILTKKGENLIRLGDGSSAVPELLRAIDLRPDYWPPYVALSDYHKEIGDLKTARDMLVKALSAAPDAGVLKRRLAELDRMERRSGNRQ